MLPMKRAKHDLKKWYRIKIKNMGQMEFLLTASFTIREMLATVFLLDLKRGGEKTN